MAVDSGDQYVGGVFSKFGRTGPIPHPCRREEGPR
jgi:hypothetical protein